MADANFPQISKETQPASLFGERLIRAGACAYHPHINPDDLLLIDFDQAAPDVDGFYIFDDADDDGQVSWVGCRRVEFSVTRGALVDHDGQGDMRPLHESRCAVIGKVLRVYKPA